jgi:hypothetical protein
VSQINLSSFQLFFSSILSQWWKADTHLANRSYSFLSSSCLPISALIDYSIKHVGDTLFHFKRRRILFKLIWELFRFTK